MTDRCNPGRGWSHFARAGIADNGLLGGIGDGQGVEAFYNIQATKALTITPDVQWISQARQNVDDAYVLGLRANVAF